MNGVKLNVHVYKMYVCGHLKSSFFGNFQNLSVLS